MMGYRQAAVTLHGVAEEDRSWVLNALPAAERETLQQLLDELKELGFADDAALAIELSSSASNAASYAPGTAVERIRRAKAEHLFSILKDEPSSLIAQFLSIERWSWSKDFLNLFPVGRKERILSSGTHTDSIATAKVAFLLDSIANRLSEMTVLSDDFETGMLPSKSPLAWASLRRLVNVWTR